MAISKILVFVETFLVLIRKTAYKSYEIKFFENGKMLKLFCDG